MLGLRAASFFKTTTKFLPARASTSIFRRTMAVNNFNDPDASKPTLDIDPFAKAERLKRPVSPDLFIYQPQLTWVLSGLHRATGGAVAVLFYLVAMPYAVLPVDTAALVAFVHSFPSALIFLGKVGLGLPIFFHSLNGVRHLVWDTASQLTIKGVYSTGYVVIGGSAILTALYALLY